MHISRPVPLVAAMLLSSAAMAHASVDATDVGFSCSQTLSIDDAGGFLVDCTGDLRVFGGGTGSVRSQDTDLDASWPSTASNGGQVVLRAGGDVRLGGGLDPNRAQVVQGGGVILSANFSGVVFGSQFDEGAHLSAGPSSIGGQITGVFFGAGGASSGVVDVTRPGLSGGSRYIAPFMPPRVVAGTLSPVPEPSTWALLLGGLGLMALARRRQSA